MSDEEYENFEVTDYDLQTEFNPNRFRRKMTKNQHIYGMWADDDSDNEERRPRNSRSNKPDYTSGVSFVSGGIQGPSKSEQSKDKEGKGNEDGGEGGGEEEDIPVTDSSSEDEAAAIPKAFVKYEENQIAGLRSKNSGGTGGKAMGMFGIGAQLALKMGWQPGKGLGKDEQGITAPIEAVVRKGRGAIGAYGRETKTKPAEIIIDDSVQKTGNSGSGPTVQQKAEKKWRKNEPKENVEVRYMTIEQVLEQKNLIVRPDAGKLAKTKVIDLTGPETRILSGYHAISGQKRPQDEWEIENMRRDKAKEERLGLSAAQKDVFDLPELTHNINLLLETCEQDILKNDKKGRYAADRVISIEQEQKRLQKVISQEEEVLKSVEALLAKLKSLTESTDSLDIESAYAGFMEIQQNHHEEWEMYEIYSLIPSAIVPSLLKHLKQWRPLDNPDEPFPLFIKWKQLLEMHHKEFNILIWEGWMPTVRQHLASWNAKMPSTLLHFLQTWQTLLPAWIYNNLLDQIILPKISESVEAWDPLSDTIPIHSWIHPWSPSLGSKLEIVYPTIRRKFAAALVHWHPCDSSAKQILKPWVSIFSKGSMDAFLIKNIVPKLQNVLEKELIITPVNQNLDIWNSVMDWIDFIPIKLIVNILETSFFPKWLQFIVNWLNQRPNFDEIFRWYTWWRSIIPEGLMNEKSVTDQLQKALQMINTSIQNPATQLDFSFIQQQQQQAAQPPPPQMPMPPPLMPQQIHLITPELMADALRMTSTMPFGFRDLVQLKCEELGILFVPIPNRFYEGKQVYRCGNAAIYISANVIFVLDSNTGLWLPTSLEQLLLHFARL